MLVDMMARHLLLVTVGLYCAFFGVLRQAVHSMTHQDEIDTTGRYLDPVIALQIPGDACLSEMVSSAEVQDFLFYRRQRSQGGIPGAGFAVDEPCLSLLRIGLFPFVIALPADAEVPAGL